ncbi:MAG: phosphoribosylamine--glycine ligase [Actinobacteria bacterium]|nr:phosphoribosylamine--glycine ligase [Actinomycetota bacterium]MCG2806980.1 phosphoribosylamine--glycine ligase [Coriobacteriia bacterium]
MRILVLGGGGREHAIVVKLAESVLVTDIHVAPGNGGTAGIAKNISLDVEDGDAVAGYALANDVGLVVIGPEAPLVAGVADVVREAGIPVFGPGASGARLEGSKSFSKELMARHGLPAGFSSAFTDLEEALGYLGEVSAPIVIKADGLAAGKGVTVAMDVHTAREAIKECFEGRFGEAGNTVLVEEFLTGPECSLLAFTDGITVVPMAPAQDHKRAYENDEGPNTGGMGVYSPVPIVTDAEYDAMLDVMERTVAGLRSEGIDYRGVLYGGFILTDEGPKLLEFNARFGDPETQVVLPRLDGDLAEIMLACAEQRLADVDLAWKPEWAVSVVIASGGYPGEYKTGKMILGVERAAVIPGVTVYHAGTTLSADGTLLTAGGRVLNVTALGASFAEARQRAYDAVDCITWESMFFRTDIGAKAQRGRDAWKD